MRPETIITCAVTGGARLSLDPLLLSHRANRRRMPCRSRCWSGDRAYSCAGPWTGKPSMDRRSMSRSFAIRNRNADLIINLDDRIWPRYVPDADDPKRAVLVHR